MPENLTDATAERAIAERYIDEMLDAEKNVDYDAFIVRFEPTDLENFPKEKFENDMKNIREELGDYISRDYLGQVKGFVHPAKNEGYPDCIRFVWRGVFERNEAIVTMGIHKRSGQWFVNEIMYR